MRTSRWIGGFVGGAAAVLAIWLTATAAWADLRVPGPAKRPDPASTTRTVSFEVMVATSGGSDTPTLIIPREAVKGLADGAPLSRLDGDRFAAADVPATLADPAGADGAGAVRPDDVPAVSSRLHSIIAGLSVALAVALGGVWIARGRSRTTARGLMLLLTASLCLGVSVTAWADARPPQPKPTPSPKTDAPSTRLETAFTGKVQVKFVSGDGAVQLVLPRADVEKLVGRESKDAAPGK